MSTTWERVRAYLERSELKHEGGDQWRCNNPWRAGADGKSFRLKIAPDGEHGTYHDFTSEESGSLYDLAGKLNIEPARQPKAVEQSKRPYANLEEYAQVKGVPAQAFVDMQWCSSVRMVTGRPAIEYPTRGGKRWRFLDGNKPSFISQPGYQRCWYALARAVRLAKETGQPLIICNGEPSVIVAQYFGVAATAVAGGEQKNIPEILLSELKHEYTGPVQVALDCDYKGVTSALELTKQFQNAGFTATAIDLMMGNTGDLADFCKLYQQDAVKQLTQCKAIVPTAFTPTVPTPPVEVSYCSDVEALQVYIDELNGDSVPSVPPMVNPYNFLHRFGGLGHIVTAGKVLYFASVSGGTKTIGFETGWEKYQMMGIHSVIYTPEWVDDRGAIEMAARSVQRAGGVSYRDKMLHALHQYERQYRMQTNAGVELDAPRICDSIAKANALIRRPGRAFFIKEPGLSAEKLCQQIEAICDLEAARGNIIRSAWLDFAQLLWLEHPESSGRLWIETAIGLFKDTCRRKNLVGFVSSQMKKGDAESAKDGGGLSSDMMQWLSDQQANFVMAFVPLMVEGKRMTVTDPATGREVGLLRGKILKNSLEELKGEEFEIPVDYYRLRWMEKTA